MQDWDFSQTYNVLHALTQNSIESSHSWNNYELPYLAGCNDTRKKPKKIAQIGMDDRSTILWVCFLLRNFALFCWVFLFWFYKKGLLFVGSCRSVICVYVIVFISLCSVSCTGYIYWHYCVTWCYFALFPI